MKYSGDLGNEEVHGINVFTIKQLIEKTGTKNLAVYVAFLDLEKAFSRVSQKEVWKSLSGGEVMWSN